MASASTALTSGGNVSQAFFEQSAEVLIAFQHSHEPVSVISAKVKLALRWRSILSE